MNPAQCKLIPAILLTCGLGVLHRTSIASKICSGITRMFEWSYMKKERTKQDNQLPLHHNRFPAGES